MNRFYLLVGICLYFICGMSIHQAIAQATVRVKTSQKVSPYDRTSKPVGGIAFRIGAYSGITDANGFDSVVVPQGYYKPVADMPCPQLDQGTLLFQSGKTYDIEFLMYTEGNCSPVAGGLIKVKIATTKSCNDDPNGAFSVQEGVTVSIGNKTFTSNAAGVIEAELPAGTYPVTANWKDYVLGFVNQNNLRAKRPEGGNYTVDLRSAGELIEVRMFTCDPTGQPKARAIVLEGGSIKVIRSNASGNAFVGMQLRDGDMVTVKGTGKLKWIEGNGIISFLDPLAHSSIQIGPEPPGGTAAPYKASSVEVLKGVVEFMMPVDPDRDARDENGNIIKFKPATRTVAIGIKGTVFSLGYDEQTQISTIEVKQGVVWVTPTNPSLQPFTLNAGQRAEVGPDRVNPPGTPVASGGGDLSGLWEDDGRAATYRVRQIGNRFYWGVDATSLGSYANTYRGEINGDTITGEWVDLPGSPSLSGGTLTLRIVSNNKLVKISSSAYYGAHEWRRKGSADTDTTSTTPPPSAPVSPTPPSSSTSGVTQALPINWRTDASQGKDQFGKHYTFDCPPDGTLQSVWGTDTYTMDSSICTAAVHAGKITRRNGGRVTIRIERPIPRYMDSLRNAGTDNEVSSRAWDNPVLSYQSFVFVASPVVGLQQQVTPSTQRTQPSTTLSPSSIPEPEELPEDITIEGIPEDDIPDDAQMPNGNSINSTPTQTPNSASPAILELVEVKQEPSCQVWPQTYNTCISGETITELTTRDQTHYYRWNTPPKRISAQGFELELYVLAQSLPGSRLVTGINVLPGGFEVDVKSPRVDVDSENGRKVEQRLKMTLKPPVNPTGEYVLSIGANWSAGFQYRYRVVK